MDIYFYIDESGLLRGEEERFFLISCIATDTPKHIESTLSMHMVILRIYKSFIV